MCQRAFLSKNMVRRLLGKRPGLVAKPPAHIHFARTLRSAGQQSPSLPPSALLQLIWLASPALPVGGFSYSEGLEYAVESARVATEIVASDWLTDQLHLSLARGDLAVIAKAIPAWQRGDMERMRELNRWVLHTRESAEFRLQSLQMGSSFMTWRKSLGYEATQPVEEITYPIAFATAAADTRAPTRDCMLAFAFGWAENMVQAAIKSVPLGQSSGQRILQRLHLEIPTAVGHAMLLADSERQTFSPMLAILSAQHETQYSRIFRS